MAERLGLERVAVDAANDLLQAEEGPSADWEAARGRFLASIDELEQRAARVGFLRTANCGS